MKDVCAQIEDALESRRRGEISLEDYQTMKTNLKAQLPILTPHATFKNGRRLNADAIPSGLSIYDKDHIPDPRGWWKVKSEELRVKNPSAFESIVLVHVTPSMEGLRLVFVIPEGMDLAAAQKWMSLQLEDDEYDTCVKDLARPSFLVPESISSTSMRMSCSRTETHLVTNQPSQRHPRLKRHQRHPHLKLPQRLPRQ